MGLDAVTFIPGVGIAGKAAKTAKIIRKMKPMLSAGFSALGLSAAYDSLNKNSEWTLDDYRNILFGVQGLLGSKRVLDRTIGYKKQVYLLTQMKKYPLRSFKIYKNKLQTN